MKTYIDAGRELRFGSSTIPKAPGNPDFDRAQKEIAAGEAVVVPAPADPPPSLDSILAATDGRMGRVVEDLIVALLAAQVFPLSGLSPAAIKLINERRAARGESPIK